jgi:hypothetical protein
VKLALTALLLVSSAAAFAWPAPASPAAETVDYPAGYREWAHVKSMMFSPGHALFDGKGGFQHVYANRQAMAGYRTRSFPEGSMIVVDWLETTDRNGVYLESSRRQVDVMLKDSRRYAATGNWGFQRFVKDSSTELATTPAAAQCFACHKARQVDGLVLSKYRP